MIDTDSLVDERMLCPNQEGPIPNHSLLVCLALCLPPGTHAFSSFARVQGQLVYAHARLRRTTISVL